MPVVVVQQYFRVRAEGYVGDIFVLYMTTADYVHAVRCRLVVLIYPADVDRSTILEFCFRGNGWKIVPFNLRHKNAVLKPAVVFSAPSIAAFVEFERENRSGVVQVDSMTGDLRNRHTTVDCSRRGCIFHSGLWKPDSNCGSFDCYGSAESAGSSIRHR